MTDLALPEDWQIEGAQFLADRRHAFLADEPGCGKSCQAIRACDAIGAWSVLILVPASVRVNWLREFEKFSVFDRPGVAVLDGKTRPVTGINVCSYDLVVPLRPTTKKRALAKLKAQFEKDMRPIDLCAAEDVARAKVKEANRLAKERQAFRWSLYSRQWDVLILDEAHFLKEKGVSRTIAVYGQKTDTVGALASRATNVWRLSGTPAPNHVDELWTHLRSAGLYQQNWFDFVATFCTGFDSDYGFRITGTKNADTLKALLAPFMLRRKKADVIPKLPPIEFEHRTIEPALVDEELFFPTTVTAGNAYLHEELAEQNAQLKAAREGKADVLETLRMFAPSAGTLRKYIGLSKVPGYLAVIRPELKARRYDKLLIGAWHTDVIEWLQRELRDYGAVILFGGTPAAKRQALLDKFKGNRACRVLICQVKVGIGFNATAAYRVDLLEPSWVPAENKQLIDRVHRIGQTGAVTARFFGCDRSIDADITRALAQKAKELAKVFD